MAKAKTKRKEQIDSAALSRAQLARALNSTPLGSEVISDSAIGKWITRGCPTNSDKSLNLLNVFSWIVMRQGGKLKEKGGIDFSKLKAELMKSQTEANRASTEFRRTKNELDELKLKVEAGELLTLEKVEKERDDFVNFVLALLGGIPGYAPKVQGKNLSKARVALGEIETDMRKQLAGDK